MLTRALMLNPMARAVKASPSAAYWYGATFLGSIAWDATARRLTFNENTSGPGSTPRPLVRDGKVGLTQLFPGGKATIYGLNRNGLVQPELASYPTTGEPDGTRLYTDLSRLYSSRFATGGLLVVRVRDFATGAATELASTASSQLTVAGQIADGRVAVYDQNAATLPIVSIGGNPTRLIVNSYSDRVDTGLRLFGPGGASGALQATPFGPGGAPYNARFFNLSLNTLRVIGGVARASYGMTVTEYGFTPDGDNWQIVVLKRAETGVALVGSGGITLVPSYTSSVLRNQFPSRQIAPNQFVRRDTETWNEPAGPAATIPATLIGRNRFAHRIGTALQTGFYDYNGVLQASQPTSAFTVSTDTSLYVPHIDALVTGSGSQARISLDGGATVGAVTLVGRAPAFATAVPLYP